MYLIRFRPNFDPKQYAYLNDPNSPAQYSRITEKVAQFVTVSKPKPLTEKAAQFSRIVDCAIETLRDKLPSNIQVSMYDTTDYQDLPEWMQNGGTCLEYDFNGDTGNTYELHMLVDLKAYCQYQSDEYGQPSYKTLFNYRFEEFIEGLGIPSTQESLFLFSVLHELGHIYIFELFYDPEIRGSQAFTAWESMQIGSRTFFQELWYTECLRKRTFTDAGKLKDHWKSNGVSMPQFSDGIESQADIFAMKNFVPVWNQLIKTGLTTLDGE